MRFSGEARRHFAKGCCSRGRRDTRPQTQNRTFRGNVESSAGSAQCQSAIEHVRDSCCSGNFNPLCPVSIISSIMRPVLLMRAKKAELLNEALSQSPVESKKLFHAPAD